MRPRSYSEKRFDDHPWLCLTGDSQLLQAKFFTELRLLQRAVTVQLLSLPASTATPFQASAATAPASASIFIGSGKLIQSWLKWIELTVRD